MNEPRRPLRYAEMSEVNQLGEIILGCALKVHRALGPGLLENAYEACLTHELAKAGVACERQLALPVSYDGVQIDLGYRLDLLVERQVVVEVKAVERLHEIHRAQVLSYLKLGVFPLGYLLNFNVKMLTDGMQRFVRSA